MNKRLELLGLKIDLAEISVKREGQNTFIS